MPIAVQEARRVSHSSTPAFYVENPAARLAEARELHAHAFLADDVLPFMTTGGELTREWLDAWMTAWQTIHPQEGADFGLGDLWRAAWVRRGGYSATVEQRFGPINANPEHLLEVLNQVRAVEDEKLGITVLDLRARYDGTIFAKGDGVIIPLDNMGNVRTHGDHDEQRIPSWDIRMGINRYSRHNDWWRYKGQEKKGWYGPQADKPQSYNTSEFYPEGHSAVKRLEWLIQEAQRQWRMWRDTEPRYSDFRMWREQMIRTGQLPGDPCISYHIENGDAVFDQPQPLGNTF